MTTKAERIQELQQLYDTDGWTAIKAVAEALDIPKPEAGWESAISMIAEKEAAIANPPEPEVKVKVQESSEPVATPWRKRRTGLYGELLEQH